MGLKSKDFTSAHKMVVGPKSKDLTSAHEDGVEASKDLTSRQKRLRGGGRGVMAGLICTLSYPDDPIWRSQPTCNSLVDNMRWGKIHQLQACLLYENLCCVVYS